MSEPVDIVAEIRAYALEGCPTTDTFNEWADHMERLQAEVADLKIEVAIQRFSNTEIAIEFKDEVERLRSELVGVKLFSNLQAEAIKDEVIVIGEPYREADWKETAAKAILGEPNPPYPVVPKRPRLIRNAAHCRTCNTTIESKSRHSLVVCGCPQDSSTGIFVDGGLAYSRRGAGVNADYFDLCEYEGDKK